MAHALCNSLVCFVSSLASRRSKQLRGEHIHRFFKIPVRKTDAESLANEALIKLNYDHNRRTLIQFMQVFFLEEISLIPAELFAAMDIILKNVKGNDESFGGAMVIANGDCCQLPNITGCNIFEACTFLFAFDFHFLQQFVRMVDPIGQRLLMLLEKRPIVEDDIPEIIDLISNNCNFVDEWSHLNNTMVMKVFGKRKAERTAVQTHFQEMYRKFPSVTKLHQSRDEVTKEGTHNWTTACKQASIFVKVTKNLRWKHILKKLF